MAFYIHWQDYYKTEFLKSYNTFLDSKITKTLQFYDNFYDLFKKSCTLLKYYLNNNGLYQFSDIEVIKEAFYIELINDGDAWMDVVHAINLMKNDSDFANNIDYITSVIKKNKHVFEQLKNKTEGLL